MPTYAFRCTACQHEFEVRTSWSKKDETTCPECGSDALKEQFGRYTIGTVRGSSDAPTPPDGGFT